MKRSTRNKIKGNLHEVKGAIKVKAGQITHNSSLIAKGRREKFSGKVQTKIGQIEKLLGT